MRALAAIALLLPLAACAVGDELARDAARRAVHPVLAERFPGLPLEPATDCVIDNATAGEITSLAADAVTGPTASTVETVNTILLRPKTITCLIAEGLPPFLAGMS